MDLVRLDAVKRFLAEATDFSALLDIQRKVDAALLYAKRSDLHDAQNELAEAKVRIDRRIGQMITEMPKHKGGRPETGSSVEPVSRSHPGTLKDLGVAKTTAMRLQQEAPVACLVTISSPLLWNPP